MAFSIAFFYNDQNEVSIYYTIICKIKIMEKKEKKIKEKIY
jgi:hypothetical protein